ncbi:UDP-N-acetylenolpyruvoylglucosamine reductase [Moorella glycerini]|uniref:UDP-N-acetylenolpyruvoylglucosamine reductase n=1 Tax=Neomoorella stamsii TaxID=1266720 RepID=A0A9X7J3H0_9FIRM|nr:MULTISPECIES: UDP-N-acetylmuramate dehydrogenase [Moorella]PRR72209.1 UDP-N-acetylenolpyruvoylglucosamine reductase [Moorella stamsii]CEP69510.1 UDP-N-acetylenolpyruvoylglucosamine reductase [Moorella glycerini]
MHLATLARELQQGLQGEVLINEPLARHTTWRIGGPADLLARPATGEEIDFCLGFARQKGLPLHIMGNGSNLLVGDGGVRGLVVQTKAWRQVLVQGRVIRACAGAFIARVLDVAGRAGLGGLEFAAGIPATIGGAVVMNAGTPEGCLGDIVRGVEVIAPDGSRYYLERRDITFSYRYSSLRQEGTVVAVDLAMTASDPLVIQERVRKNLEGRQARQPLEWPNAGSVFKNPAGYYAGQLIEEVGAKGWQAGQAQVSTKHANFIINLGRATAADVLELIARIQEAVARAFGINLELEVEIWGDSQ